MSLFGWSYPPGCSSRDVDEALGVDREPHPAEDEIGEILSAAEVDQDVIDSVVEKVAAVCDELEAAQDREDEKASTLEAQVVSLTRERDVLRDRLELYVPAVMVTAILRQAELDAAAREVQS